MRPRIWGCLVLVGLSSLACATDESSSPGKPSDGSPVTAPEPAKSGKRHGGGGGKACVEGQRTCKNDDVYSCIEGTLQLAEDCEPQFECTTTVPGSEGQAMCDPGGM